MARRQGKAIRRKEWEAGIKLVPGHAGFLMRDASLDADDWEVVEEHGPCPFCGGQGAIMRRGNGYPYVACLCGAEGRAEATEDGAWHAWDRRTP